MSAATIDWTKAVTAEDKAAIEQAALLKRFSAAIQSHLDATAQQRQYDSIQTAVSYRDDPNPQFAAEASALFAWRSSVWTYAMQALEAVAGGNQAVPTEEAFVASLPPFEWP